MRESIRIIIRFVRLMILSGVVLMGTQYCAFAPGMDMDEPILVVGHETESEFEGTPVHLREIHPEILMKYPELTRPLALDVPINLLERTVENYHLGPFDIVVVTVWEHPELSQPLGQFRADQATGQVIDKDGYMYYPYIGTIQAANLTTSALRVMIQKRLARFLKDPQVDVKILRYRNKTIYVGGAVKKPGMKFISDVPMTIPWAIDQSGGLNLDADGSLIYLTRGDSVYKVDLVSMYREKSHLEKILLSDGDKIHVATKNETKVFVLGEVESPKAIEMLNRRLTLAEVIAEVGGLDKMNADAEEIYVLRMGDKKIDLFHLNAENPLALVVGEQFKLHPRDIVYIDTHGLARWNRVINLLLPTMNLMRGGFDGQSSPFKRNGQW
ncbi:MAG: polysaccharide biosynthesis/export family protein [Fibrobacterales bacterium]